ncbi:hypothetical protein FRB95_014147 [Tulasnella sp. JGI-2019a]|nr:hypothetical protein FRB95_014147 [Tulasnella sp. JGI-2019a]
MGGNVSRLGSQWDLQLDTFGSLRVLDFQTTVLQANIALTARHPSCLTMVYLQTVGPVHNREVLSMLSVLASSSPLLECFYLNMFSTTGLSEERFRFDILMPLLQYGLLKLLEVGHPRSITLTEENISTMTGSWPLLHTLLFSGGSPLDKHRTPLSILRSFARYPLLRLRDIGLPCSIDLENLRGDPAPMALGSLNSLDLTTTVILPEQQLVVSVFLGFICPSNMAVYGGMGNWQCEVMNDDEKYDALWAAVRDGVRDFHNI